jgi:hypothetical protein
MCVVERQKYRTMVIERRDIFPYLSTSPKPTSAVFSFAAQKCEDQHTQNDSLAFVLYGCETWSITLREEHRLALFGKTLLRKIFGLERGEVTGEWKKLQN